MLQIQRVLLDYYPDYLASQQKIANLIDVTAAEIDPNYAATRTTSDRRIEIKN